MLCCQCEEHEVSGAATYDILCLLPEKGPNLQLWEIGSDVGRARNRTAGNIGPVRAVQAVTHSNRFSSHTRNE